MIRKDHTSCGWVFAGCEAAFSVFSFVLKSPEMMKLNEEARWLGKEVGRLRDLDVVANDIVQREAQAHPQEPGFAAVTDTLRAVRRSELRGRLCELLVEPRAQAFLIDLGAVRGDARLARAAGFYSDRAAGSAGDRVRPTTR